MKWFASPSCAAKGGRKFEWTTAVRGLRPRSSSAPSSPSSPPRGPARGPASGFPSSTASQRNTPGTSKSAAKREKAAFDLYTDLARVYTTIPDVKKIFDVLAQEEAYHKLKLEREYDEVVYKED